MFDPHSFPAHTIFDDEKEREKGKKKNRRADREGKRKEKKNKYQAENDSICSIALGALKREKEGVVTLLQSCLLLR